MKAFVAPDIEVKKFSVEDVITTSSNTELEDNETEVDRG
jgi:hypothetical protein